MIKPLPGYVLVEPIEEELKTSAGVYLPESTKDKPSRGKVVDKRSLYDKNMDDFYLHASGEHIAIDVNVGDIVIYKKWVNQEVQDDDKKYLLVKFEDLMATVD